MAQPQHVQAILNASSVYQARLQEQQLCLAHVATVEWLASIARRRDLTDGMTDFYASHAQFLEAPGTMSEGLEQVWRAHDSNPPVPLLVFYL